ncbi:MAG TPA: hypothetical protein VFL59_12010 [Candidatus Nanopelagicales bacterium]|nr:hypothetical protein [Candidatus Nanopelagicales bacterium]
MSTTTERDGRGHVLLTCTLAALILIPITACGGGSSSPPTSTAPSSSSPPTSSSPTTSTSPPTTPTTPSATPVSLPWVASVVRAEVAVGPNGEAVEVTTDASSGSPTFTRVELIGDSATDLLGWYGTGRRTLVWATGQDLKSLRSATFTSAGTIAEKPAPLRIPGVVTTYGYGFPQPDGSLVWVRETRTTPSWEMVVLSPDLTVLSRRAVPLNDEGTPQFATASSVGVRTSETTLSVWRPSGVTTVALPKVCAQDTSGTPARPEKGGTVILRCGPEIVALVPTGSTTRAIASAPLPGGALVVGEWADAHAVQYASSGSGSAVRTWRLSDDGSRWTAAAQQGVVAGTLASGVLYVARHGSDGTRWYAETAPRVPLSPAIPPASPESLVTAIRATM